MRTAFSNTPGPIRWKKLQLVCPFYAHCLSMLWSERWLTPAKRLTLILARAHDFEWETTMALLFLCAKDHRITAGDLDDTRDEFARLDVETSRTVLNFYMSRRRSLGAELEHRHLPQLHER